MSDEPIAPPDLEAVYSQALDRIQLEAVGSPHGAPTAAELWGWVKHTLAMQEVVSAQLATLARGGAKLAESCIPLASRVRWCSDRIAALDDRDDDPYGLFRPDPDRD